MSRPVLVKPQVAAEATSQAVQQALRFIQGAELPPTGRPPQAELAQQFLGVHAVDATRVSFGLWAPGFEQGGLWYPQRDQLFLECLVPQKVPCLDTLVRGETVQTTWYRHRIPVSWVGDEGIALTVVEGLPLGTPTQLGPLYWWVFQPTGHPAQNTPFIFRDPLAQSTPFGVYAPAEAVDLTTLEATRADLSYFTSHVETRYPDGSYRAKPIGVTLEIHPETATEEGTIAALTARYRHIAQQVRQNLAQGLPMYDGLSLADKNLVGFDTLELTPEVPPVEREGNTCPTGEFFQIVAGDDQDDTITVALKKPDISNWGYDTPIIGTASVNPSILQTCRPFELIELIETLHTMPGRPIQISLDAVLGHADFQGALLLATPDTGHLNPMDEPVKYVHSAYFRGANMYGRDLNYSHPMVRAILLEMYRKKIQYGFDCVRVDGGQDFVAQVDPDTGYRIQDDAFIYEMVSTTQTINGITRRLDMNVEDGRPWPNDMNWLYNATYTEHILAHQLPYGDRVRQWGSLIFAHNVHGKFKWFQTKWDRFKDTFKDAQYWITGHSNHDNARYFYRLTMPTPGSAYQAGQSFEDYYNDQLGPDFQTAAHAALDNPALSALVLGFLPGSPMFFYNALMRAPWLFFRNTDDRYGVKVVADEGGRFLTWYVNEARYAQPSAFKRLKAMGFDTLRSLVAHPASGEQAWMDVLFELHELIKTDATICLALFDDPQDHGVYPTLDALQARLGALATPATAEARELVARLEASIAADPQESERKLTFALKFFDRTRFYHPNLKTDPVAQKLYFLSQLGREPQHRRLLALLLEEQALENSYDLAAWGTHPKLTLVAPRTMLNEEGVVPPERLKAFAHAFMADAKDLAMVPQYEAALDPAQVNFNLALREFRLANPWLILNPYNDVLKDFFNRKILANGAKNTGAFFSDKGDIVNANTVYYGWRTSIDNTRQVALVAVMEGKPLDRLALRDYLPPATAVGGDQPWQVVAASPRLQAQVGTHVGLDTLLRDVRNGDALVLTRQLG